MKKLILSTIGTSLITNPASKEEQHNLYEYSNCREDNCPPEIKNLIESLIPKVLDGLFRLDSSEIRKASAELNGIYGIYNNDLKNRGQDIHFLISTDTYQGRKSAHIVEVFLEKFGLTVETVIPKDLSTLNKNKFSEGVKSILKWCDETLPGYKHAGYEIIFNLTGGFKSLQGFMNSIAMFYADRITYIFESAHAELIEIPRLPIKIDRMPFENHKDKFLLLNAGKIFSLNEFDDVPESILDPIDNYVIFSVWGELIWNQLKYDLFEELPELLFIKYEGKFIKKYKDTVDNKTKIRLLETIAKVSVIMETSNGNTSELSKGSIQYSPLLSQRYTDKQLYHFRSDLGLRVNCVPQERDLLLIEFGTHDETQ